jgi:hypothetical protein
MPVTQKRENNHIIRTTESCANEHRRFPHSISLSHARQEDKAAPRISVHRGGGS